MMPLASGIQSKGNTGRDTFVISIHNEGIDNGRHNTILPCFVKDALRRHFLCCSQDLDLRQIVLRTITFRMKKFIKGVQNTKNCTAD
jgi:hypothetical protein